MVLAHATHLLLEAMLVLLVHVLPFIRDLPDGSRFFLEAVLVLAIGIVILRARALSLHRPDSFLKPVFVLLVDLVFSFPGITNRSYLLLETVLVLAIGRGLPSRTRHVPGGTFRTLCPRTSGGRQGRSGPTRRGRNVRGLISRNVFTRGGRGGFVLLVRLVSERKIMMRITLSRHTEDKQDRYAIKRRDGDEIYS